MKRRLSPDERMVVQLKYAEIVHEGHPTQPLSSVSYRGRTYHLWEIAYNKRAAKSVAEYMQRHGFGTYIHTMISGPKREYYVFVRLKRK